jgi:hypothetical protein
MKLTKADRAKALREKLAKYEADARKLEAEVKAADAAKTRRIHIIIGQAVLRELESNPSILKTLSPMLARHVTKPHERKVIDHFIEPDHAAPAPVPTPPADPVPAA